MYIVDSKKVYVVNLTTLEKKEIWEIKQRLYQYSIIYLNNKTELIISYNKEFILFDDKGEQRFISHPYNYRNFINIIKYKNEYYILKKTQILILNEKKEFREYEITNTIEFYSEHKRFVKLFIYNDELYYTYYSTNEMNGITHITINLVKCDLKNNIFINEELDFSYTCRSSWYDFILHNICVYEEHLIFMIYDKITKVILLIKYNLLTEEILSINLKNSYFLQGELYKIESYNDNLVFEQRNWDLNKLFIIFDIVNLEFKQYIKLDNKSIKNYYWINFNNYNKNIIIYTQSTNIKEPSFIHIYENNITYKNLKLGALSLKYIFKNLGFEYGQHTDIKEQILNKMQSDVELDEEDTITKYKIKSYEYSFQKEILLE
jgi:hypothetical protein